MTPEEKKALLDAIVKNLTTPEEVTTDAGSVTSKSLKEQIAALKELQAISADASRPAIKRVGFYRFNSLD